jgi:hypothetical protein
VKHLVIEAKNEKKRKSCVSLDILVSRTGKRRKRTTTVVEEQAPETNEGPSGVQGGTEDDEDEEFSEALDDDEDEELSEELDDEDEDLGEEPNDDEDEERSVTTAG